MQDFNPEGNQLSNESYKSFYRARLDAYTRELIELIATTLDHVNPEHLSPVDVPYPESFGQHLRRLMGRTSEPVRSRKLRGIIITDRNEPLLLVTREEETQRLLFVKQKKVHSAGVKPMTVRTYVDKEISEDEWNGPAEARLAFITTYVKIAGYLPEGHLLRQRAETLLAEAQTIREKKVAEASRKVASRSRA